MKLPNLTKLSYYEITQGKHNQTWNGKSKKVAIDIAYTDQLITPFDNCKIGYVGDVTGSQQDYFSLILPDGSELIVVHARPIRKGTFNKGEPFAYCNWHHYHLSLLVNGQLECFLDYSDRNIPMHTQKALYGTTEHPDGKWSSYQDLQLNITPTAPTFDYELELKGRDIYMDILSGSFKGYINWTRPGLDQTVYIDKFVGNNGSPIVIDANDKTEYTVNANGIIKKIYIDYNPQPQPVDPTPPPQPVKETCEEQKNKLQNELMEAQGYIKDLEINKKAMKARHDKLEREALANLNVAKEMQEDYAALLETIKENPKKEKFDFLKTYKSLMREGWLQTLVGGIITLGVGYLCSIIPELQDQQDTIVTGLLGLLGIVQIKKKVKK